MNLNINIVKYPLIFVVIFVVYQAYKHIMKPVGIRARYKKYRNVYVRDKFIPLIGEADKYIEDSKKGRATYYHLIEYALQLKGIDIRLSILGDNIIFNMFSLNSLKEFQNLCPGSIDRKGIPTKSFGKLFPSCSIHQKSTDRWKIRRETFLKEIGINFASRFIPCMIEAIGAKVDSWKVGESYDLLHEMADTTYDVITVILFGRNVNKEIGNLDYIDSNTMQTSSLQFNIFYTKVSRDVMSTRFLLKSIFFPFLCDYNLTNPYNVHYKNIVTLWNSLKEYLKKSKEEDSLFNRIMKTGEITEEEAFQDVLGLLFAGHETSSHAISTTMFFLHKYPETADKLSKELSIMIGKSHEELKELINKSTIQEYDYLYNVVKEGLRIDPPGSDALPYEVNKNVTICGVPIDKGSIINVNLLNQHYNPEEWQEPLKFIPERFDPESDYFYKPGEEKKPRNPLSWVPFSFGLRNCPGQTLALLEIKVFIAYLMARVNFQFRKEDLESPYAYFAIASTLSLPFTHTLK